MWTPFRDLSTRLCLDTRSPASLRSECLRSHASPVERLAMRLSELLNPQCITLRLQATNKAEALVEMVDLLESGHGFGSQGEILDRVARREQMMSTALFPGAAIPHGKARSVDRMAAACGGSTAGVS